MNINEYCAQSWFFYLARIRAKFGVVGLCGMVLLGLSSACSVNETGFDEICKIVTEAKSSNLTSEQKAEYVDNNIRQRVFSVDAIQAYVAVAQADPAEKYALFKQAAEYSLKRSWDCEALK